MNKFKLNLQLFALQTTLLADLSPEMKTFYDMTLIDEASARSVVCNANNCKLKTNFFMILIS